MRVATAPEISKLIRVNLDHLYTMAQAGKIPQLRRVGPELRFDQDVIEAWLRGEVDNDGHPVDDSRTPDAAKPLADQQEAR